MQEPYAQQPASWGWTKEHLRQSIARRWAIQERHRTARARTVALAYFSTATPRAASDWLRDWWWCYDPRNASLGLPTVIPFDPYPAQAAFVRHAWQAILDRRPWGLVKSRATGATTICAGLATFGWLYVPGFAALFASRKAELVDKLGDPKAIFTVLRQGLYELPHWQLPPTFDRQAHDSQRRLVNPDSGATITGEAGDEVGRGGRSTCAFWDECASHPHARLVEAALSQTTESIGYISTPKPPRTEAGALFHRKRHGGKVAFAELRWQDDPRKNQAWREEQDQRFDPIINRQELDLDFSATDDQGCIPQEWVDAAVGLDLGDVGGLRAMGLDVADTGAALNVLVGRHGPRITRIESWQGIDTHDTTHRARRLAIEDRAALLVYDAIGVGAGVTGALAPLPGTAFAWLACNVGRPATDRRHADAPETPANERFRNLRAEAWWAMRLRFKRSWERVRGIVAHPPRECISIPDHPDLRAQLVQPKIEYTETGLLRLESKDRMARRGIASPDYADAMALALFDPRGTYWASEVRGGTDAVRSDLTGIASYLEAF